jgi:hypothetical protein
MIVIPLLAEEEAGVLGFALLPLIFPNLEELKK